MDQLANIDTDLFVVVSELPTEDIKEGKIYCIKDTSSTAQDNGYIEYAYINNKWEKIGQFQAKPNLRDYAKIDDDVTFNTIWLTGRSGDLITAIGDSYIATLKVNKLYALNNRHNTVAFTTDGTTANIGVPESFVFTLEDGSTVTKSIRVISTTTSQNVVNNNGGEDGE